MTGPVRDVADTRICRLTGADTRAITISQHEIRLAVTCPAATSLRDVLVGRETETRALWRLIEGARAGVSATIMLTGDAGLGKSALLEVAVREHTAGTHLVRCTGSEAESALPFAAVHQLLRPLRHHIDGLPGPQRTALRAVFGLDQAPPDAYLVSLATLTVLTEASAERPVVLAIDDAHWFDEQSADVLTFVLRRLEHERVAVIIATGDHGGRLAGLDEIRLGPLTGEHARALLAAECGDAVPHVADRILADAAGNPLAVVELCRALSADQVRGVEPIPQHLATAGSLTTSLLRRVGRLPEESRRLLLLAAAEHDGELSTVIAAARAADLPPESIGTAAAAGLIATTDHRLRFLPPMLRSVVYHGARTADRQWAHRSVAAVLAEDDPRRVWHRAACAWQVDEQLAAELARVAEHERRAGDHQAAARAWERAAQLTENHEHGVGHLLGAAECSWLSGHSPRAKALLDIAEPATGSAELDARMAYLRGTSAQADGALADSHRQLLDAARPVLRTHRALAEDMLVMAARAAWLGNDTDGLASARDLLGPRNTPVAETAPATLVWPRDLDPVATHALPLGTPPLIIRDVEAGRWQEAEKRALAALRRVPGGQVGTSCLLWALLAWIAAMRGDGERCRELATAALDAGTARRIALGTAVAHRALGLLALGEGKVDQASHHLREAVDDRGSGGHPAVALAALCDLVEALIREGDLGEARQLRERHARLVGQSGTAVHRALAARCRALVAGDDEAPSLFAEALSDHVLPPFEEARTRLLLGSRLRRARRVKDAKVHLHAALIRFDALGAEPWAARSRAELRAAGDPAGGEPVTESEVLAELTPRELQIVQSVAVGMTNRQIAAELFVSPRTISDHLYKLFPKLGISSRHQLRSVVADVDVNGK